MVVWCCTKECWAAQLCYVRLVAREQGGRLVDGGIVVDGVGEVRKAPLQVLADDRALWYDSCSGQAKKVACTLQDVLLCSV